MSDQAAPAEAGEGVGADIEREEHKIRVHFSLAAGAEAVPEEGGILEDQLCDRTVSILQIKEGFAHKLHQDVKQIDISFHGETLSDATVLDELGIGSDNTVTLTLHHTSSHTHSSDNTLSPMQHTAEDGGPTHSEHDHTPVDGSTAEVGNKEGVVSSPTPIAAGRNVLIATVKVGNEDKEVLIRVERSEFKKPFLGGFRHRVSGVEYHNAAVQTLPKRRPPREVPFYDRDSQTVVTRNKPQQVTMDATTQMTKDGCYMDLTGDKTLPITGVYETAEEYHKRILGHVIVLQSYWRRWLATRFVEEVRRDKLRQEEYERAELARRQREREEHAKREFYRRMNPKTKEDFDLLYHALEMWRQEEMAYIDATTSGAERKAALCGLLEQEAQLIASIGRHKVVADETNKINDAFMFLSKTAAPRRWIAFDGGLTEMNTSYTLRAEQLRDIYTTLVMENLSQDERLDVLLTLKSTVKEHDCKLTRDIVELVDREADLLVRGIKEDSLRGLRKRISSLFLQYCKTPLFNPEAAKHIKVPQDVVTVSSNIYYCRSCEQYLPSTEFELSANSKNVGHCRACRDLDNRARAREDWSTYRHMLKTLRQTEEACKDQSHIIFLMQEADLRYLVENIWGGQSALSACQDLYELRMVRWQSKKPWSPWNCLLVTRDEAASHAKLEDLAAAYGEHFIQKIQHKHFLAQYYFLRIPQMAEELDQKVQDLPLPKLKEKEIIVHMQNPQEMGVATDNDADTDTKELETS